MNEKKATVYAYVGNNRGVAVDFEGKEHRNGWVRLDLSLGMGEVIEKLSWRTDGSESVESGSEWGSNNIVIRREDLNRLTGKVLTLCDAMIADKEQKDAWKSLLRTTIHEWHDDKFQRFNLDV